MTIKEIPFKKLLTVTTTIIFDRIHTDVNAVATLTCALAQYMILEAQAASIVNPLQEARNILKNVVTDLTFKDSEDFSSVVRQLADDTDHLTSHKLEELDRDKLIRFDQAAQAIFQSSHYQAILAAGQKYQQQQKEFKDNPISIKIDLHRGLLRPLMQTFLEQNYRFEDLQGALNDPINKVNVYFNALKEDERKTNGSCK